MVKLTKIYTRTGDGGTTGLVDGSRVAKDSLRIAAIGEVDEANSAVGVAIAAGAPSGLRRVQNDLFDLGADLATPGNDFASTAAALRIAPEQIAWLEHEIDRLNADLSPLASFILPGGDAAAAALHLARAIVRRAERAAVALSCDVPTNPAVISYLNRLSDYLFVLARWVNQAGAGDVLWVPGGSR